MSRERSPARQSALKMWLDSGRELKPKEIAAKLGVSDAMVRKWKSIDKWEEQPDPKPRRRGAPGGNKNAVGNRGGPGGPPGNSKAVTHGLFRKILPDDPSYLEIFDATEDMTPLDMLWHQIRIAWTNIMDAQRKMFVKSKDEMIKELKKQKFEVHSTGRGKNKELHQIVTEEEFEFQFAWDRQATALNAQTAAMARLASMIRQYEDMLRSLPPEDVLEEQRLRVTKLKAEVDMLNKPGEGAEMWTSAIEEVAARRKGMRKVHE
ncbi:terminase [Paenibacillus chitinolyticus]|uniref:Terminase n=1 Tax=Paenibacillus chitinolyticus TaxID=79263 RepID=A0A410X095_9BACL|nr:phage terminase small subunit [Paenibacillus chitinolyticus]MCY9593733.1 phage terminase small subunit [Paenibacillus chitinolyticus]MCY9599701.1 phage terminase small subunit [Paenibacillus chitinolyticus]QAV20125.1 terminase [Paenibacillus chitinolyticus]